MLEEVLERNVLENDQGGEVDETNNIPKMYITLDNDGFINFVSYGAALENGIETEPFEFTVNIQAYSFKDGKIELDKNRLKEVINILLIQELRQRREVECFSIINRGKLWYDMLTPQQITTLNNWYMDWLRVTNTLKPPRRPRFLNERGKI